MVTAEMPLDSSVRVLEGPYRNLEGVVRGTDEEHAFVEIQLRSLEVVTAIPRVLLEVFDPLAEKSDPV
jgi:transcription antitermination factor NusG